MSNQYNSIMEGLDELMEYAKSNKIKGCYRIREVPPRVKPVKCYSKDKIKTLRINLSLSQRSFAEVLGVSQKTVEAWESGVNCPSGSSSRIIELLEKDNDILERYGVLDRQLR